MSTELLPRSVAEAEGSAYWFLNSLNIVKTTSDSTGGAFSMVYHTAPPGHATPYHLHHIEDEAFYVLDGEFTFICDGNKTIVGPCGYIFLPRGIPHGIRCSGSEPSTMLILAYTGYRVRWDDDRDGRTRYGTGIAFTDGAGYRKANGALREVQDRHSGTITRMSFFANGRS